MGTAARLAWAKEHELNPLYEQMQTSVFERMSGLAAKHKAVNLGQGFPDFGWPEEILDAAAQALKEGSNQYAPSRGLPRLREALTSWRPQLVLRDSAEFGGSLAAEQLGVPVGGRRRHEQLVHSMIAERGRGERLADGLGALDEEPPGPIAARAAQQLACCDHARGALGAGRFLVVNRSAQAAVPS